MVSLFVSVTLVRFGDFGIALAFCNPCHCKVHTHLGAFTGEVSAKPFHYFFVVNLSFAYNVFASKLAFVGYGNEFLCAANGANGYVIFYDFAANGTFFHKYLTPF